MEISRCYHCNTPFTRDELNVDGCCPDCGSRKMREVHKKITDDHMKRLVSKGFEPTKEGWEWSPDV
mgnify:CR=1 FL=1